MCRSVCILTSSTTTTTTEFLFKIFSFFIPPSRFKDEREEEEKTSILQVRMNEQRHDVTSLRFHSTSGLLSLFKLTVSSFLLIVT